MKIHTYRRRVQFSETDAAGVAHFSKLASFVEEAEHDFFRHCGVDPLPPGAGWPRLAMQIEFLAPCRFGQDLEISLHHFSLGHSTLQYQFSAHLLLHGEPPAEIFRGSMKICHAQRASDGETPRLEASEIPPATRQALGFTSVEISELPS